jgi:25S rRNA (cytosine2870-C5)-methyltransferase
MMDIYKSAHL